MLALFTLGTETLPDRLTAAGGGAWLCPLPAGGAVLAAALLLTRRPLAGRVLLSGREHPLGARAAAVLLLVTGLGITAAQAVRVALRLSEDLRGSPLLLTAALVALAAWMAAGGLAALGRACQIFALAVGLTFFFVALFGLSGLRWDWLLLWSGEELQALPRGGAVTALALSPGLYALVLLEDLEGESGARGSVLRRLAALFPLLALGTLLVTGRLGPGLAGAVRRPFFQMVSGLGFQGAFQRLEELVSALWLLGDLALLALLLLCLRRLVVKARPRRETASQVWLLAGAVLAAAGAWLRWGGTEMVVALWVPELLAGAGLLALAARGKTFEKMKKGG